MGRSCSTRPSGPASSPHASLGNSGDGVVHHLASDVAWGSRSRSCRCSDRGSARSPAITVRAVEFTTRAPGRRGAARRSGHEPAGTEPASAYRPRPSHREASSASRPEPRGCARTRGTRDQQPAGGLGVGQQPAARPREARPSRRAGRRTRGSRASRPGTTPAVGQLQTPRQQRHGARRRSVAEHPRLARAMCRCPSSPNPVTSVAADDPASSMASATPRRSAWSWSRRPARSCSGVASPRLMAVVMMPRPERLGQEQAVAGAHRSSSARCGRGPRSR